jgi:hypothetical protein
MKSEKDMREEVKAKIAEYFNLLIDQINIVCDQLLTKQNKLNQLEADEEDLDYVNLVIREKREMFVSLIEDVKAENLKKFDFIDFSEEKISKEDVFKKHCFLMNKKNFTQLFKSRNLSNIDQSFGYLIMTNQFISNEKISKLNGFWNYCARVSWDFLRFLKKKCLDKFKVEDFIK